MILKCEVLQTNSDEIQEKKERFGDILGIDDEIEETWTNGSLLIQGLDAIYESIDYKDSTVVILQSGASMIVRVNYEVLHSLWDGIDTVIGEAILDQKSQNNND